MLRKTLPTMLALVLASTIINVAILLATLSLPSRASVANMDSSALIADKDFKKAVQSIIEACTLNADLGKLRC